MKTRQEKMNELFEDFKSIRKNIMPPHIPGETSGITPSQLRVLFLIESRQGCTVKEVAKLLKISSSAATQLVDALVNIGFVVRKVSKEDRRVALLHLTAKANAQHERMKKMMFKQMMQVFKGLNDKELDQYVRLTKKISKK